MPNSAHSPQVCNIPTRTYNISVVGPSKSGKSCICNRFALPHPDSYSKDHLYILNATELSNESINCKHWLYWGCVARQLDDCVIKFRVIEQTEFLQDSTFQTFDNQNSCANNSTCNCAHKNATTHPLPNNKLQYICKENVIENSAYPRDYFPVGDVEVHGFIVVYDASPRFKELNPKPIRCSVESITFIQDLLLQIVKIKKPVLLAVSKVDKYPKGCPEDLSFLQKSNELRKVPWIETSAHANINIEEAFITLLKLIELKPRAAKLRNLSYLEACRERCKETENAGEAFDRLVSISPSEFLANWNSFMGRYSHQTDVVNFINLVGSEAAQNRFEDRVEKRRKNNRQRSLRKLRELLWHILPHLDLVSGLSFEEVISFIRNHEDFSDYFQDDCSDGAENQPPNTTMFTPLSREDGRVPLSLAIQSANEDDDDTLADCPLKDHLNNLAITKSKHLEQAILETALHQYQGNVNAFKLGPTDELLESGVILPGQPMADVKPSIPLLSSSNLTVDEITAVYKQFQAGLHVRAREDFLDLLFERTDLFVKAVRRYLGQLDDSSVSMSLTDLPMSNHQHPQQHHHQQTDYNFKAFGETNCCSLSTLPQQSYSSQFGIHSHTSSANLMQQASSMQKVRWLSAPPRGAKEMQLNWLTNQLICDRRYKTMTLLPSERQTLITTYFDMLLPMASHWPAQPSSVVRTLSNETKCTITTARKSFSIHGLWNPSGTASSSSSSSQTAATTTGATTSTYDIPSPCTVPIDNHGQQYYPDAYGFPLHQADSISLSPLACSSASWGGCMDVLFRHLACQHLPASPRCFESHPHLWEDKSEINPDWTMAYPHPDLVYPSHHHLPSPLVLLGSPTMPPPNLGQDLLDHNRDKASLFVGVACVCTDTQAARAVIHLLACAGFCMLSFMPHHDSVRSKLDTSSDRFNNLSSGLGSSIPSDDNRGPMDSWTQSLICSSAWPLPTARLPRFHPSSAPSAENMWQYATSTVTSDFYKHPMTNKIYDGQVQVGLMSHHKLLNNLLDTQDHEFCASRTMPLNMNTPNASLRNHHFGGLIFVISAPSSEDRRYNHISLVKPPPKHPPPPPPHHHHEASLSMQSLKIDQLPTSDSIDSLNSECKVDLKRSLKRMNSIDSEDLGSNDNVITPRPLSQEHFFNDSTLELDSAIHSAPISPPNHSNESSHCPTSSCTCCDILSCHRKSRDTFDCACGYCCPCVHSVLPGSTNKCHMLPNHPKSCSERPSPSSGNFMGPHRRRSWEARVAVVNSMIDQIPKHVPHLVLVAEPNVMQTSGMTNSDSEDQLPPILYPAPDQSRIPLVFDSCRLPHCSGSFSLDSDSNSVNPDAQQQQPDWIPAGTNVLDHVINFLGECWDNLDQQQHHPQQHHQQRQQHPYPHHHEDPSLQFLPTCPSDPSPLKHHVATSPRIDYAFPILRLNSEPRDTTIDTVTPDKCCSNSGLLLNSLSVASATGRRAVHSANQAFKKLSQSAKRRSAHRLSASSSAAMKDSQTTTSLDSQNPPRYEPIYDTLNEPPLATGIHSASSSIPSVSCPLSKATNLGMVTTLATTIPSTAAATKSATGSSMFSSSSPVQSVQWGLDSSSQNELETSQTVCNPTHDEPYPPQFNSIGFDRTLFRTSVSRFGIYDDGIRRSIMKSHRHSRCSVPDCTRLNSLDCSSSLDGLDPSCPLLSSDNMNHHRNRPQTSIPYSGDVDQQSFGDQVSFPRTLSNQSGRWNVRAEFESTPTVLSQFPSGHLTNRVSDCDSQLLPTDSVSVHGIGTTAEQDLPPAHVKPVMSTHTHPTGFASFHGDSLSPEQSSISYPRDDLLESIHYSGYYSDDIESIYEDPDHLVPSHDDELRQTDMKISQSTLCNPLTTTATTVPKPVSIDCPIEEHIYMDPVDCIGPAYVERYRFPMSRPIIVGGGGNEHPHCLASASGHRVSRESHALDGASHDHRSVAGHSTSAVSLSNTPSNWVSNVVGRHRERYRSFSTPEGCSTLVTESDSETSHLVSSSGDSSSAQTQSRSLLRPLFPNPAQFRSVRSSYARHVPDLNSSSSGLNSAKSPTTTAAATIVTSTTTTTTGCPSKPLQLHPPSDTTAATLRSAPVSSPVSILPSDEYTSDKLLPPGAAAMPFPTSGPFGRDSSSPGGGATTTTLSRFHHHHFWHHPNCAHYRMHQFRSHLMHPTDPKCASIFHSRPFYRNPDSSLMMDKPSNSIPTLHSTCDSSTNLGCSKHISKPIFIDPTDFPTHNPRPCSFGSSSGNARVNFANAAQLCQHSTSGGACGIATTPNTTTMSSSSPSSVSCTSKDSKWLKRSRKLNFLYHRFSGETQLSPQQSSSSSSSFPSNIFHTSKTPNRLSPALSSSTSKSTPPKSPSPSDCCCNSTSVPSGHPLSCHSLMGRCDGNCPALPLGSTVILPYKNTKDIISSTATTATGHNSSSGCGGGGNSYHSPTNAHINMTPQSNIHPDRK